MIDDAINRARDLIEDLRADVDFELDDVVSSIVRNLPEDYFQRLKRDDQLTHLKTLLAISICQLDQEIMLRSSDDRHIAVVARQNYPGQLAKILMRLPADQPLVGAKIFTSTAHDFIIDLFEFSSPDVATKAEPIDAFDVSTTVANVARELGRSETEIGEFVSHYDPSSHVLTSARAIGQHFLAYQQLKESGEISIRWNTREKGGFRVTIAASDLTAREVFRGGAEFLGKHQLDIEQAFLNDLKFSESKIAISGFVVSGEASESVAGELADFLREQ